MTTSNFEGTWKITVNGVTATYKFIGDSWEFSSDDEKETYFAKGLFSGTFTFTETTITFVCSKDDINYTWTMDYTLQNKELYLTNSIGNNPTKLGNGTLKIT